MGGKGITLKRKARSVVVAFLGGGVNAGWLLGGGGVTCALEIFWGGG